MEISIKPYLRKAQFYETDQMGIIHHANYIHWMEEARTDLMDQLGYGYAEAAKAGIHFVLMGIRCDYKSMVRFGDMIRIESILSAINPMLMTATYRMYDAATNELRCTGESRHCSFDINKQRPVRLNTALPELYDIFMQYHQSTKEKLP